MAQHHDKGRQKRLQNTLHNPAAMTKADRVAKRRRLALLTALDLFNKTGRWPRGWEQRDARKPDRAERT